MGLRGPQPDPTALKIAKGNPRGKPLNKREPIPVGLVDGCPSWLDEASRATWDELRPQLEAMGVLTRIDGHALAKYCDLWTRWKAEKKFLDENGSTYETVDKAGNVKHYRRPQLDNYHKLAAALARAEQSFGLTPSSRSGIVANPGSKKKDASHYFGSVG